MQTRIKFCGMTRLQDVQTAVGLGIDALGFVFVKASPRYIDIQTTQQIFEFIPPSINKVGLFMNPETSDVYKVLDSLNLNYLQFHGQEDEKFCSQFNWPFLKAIPMGSIVSVSEFCNEFPSATAFLLDSHVAGQMGGSGETHNWEKLPDDLEKPIILAGGLTAENVANAISVVQPYGVDVSSGIETSKGIKDPVKMKKFVKEVKYARTAHR